MKNVNIGIFLSLFLIFIGDRVAFSQSNSDVEEKVDDSLAKHLVSEAVEPMYRHIYNFYEEHNFININFVEFQYEQDGTGYGFYAVNQWTGAVWDTWSACKRISTPALERDRAKIRKRFRPGELKEYDRLDAIHPTCVDD